jgi:hypothetical protein
MSASQGQRLPGRAGDEERTPLAQGHRGDDEPELVDQPVTGHVLWREAVRRSQHAHPQVVGLPKIIV